MIIHHALTTEKAVAVIERQNTLVFIIDQKATKSDVKSALETAYNEKVKKVRTLHGLNGKKKAIVVFIRKGAAADLAAKLKVI